MASFSASNRASISRRLGHGVVFALDVPPQLFGSRLPARFSALRREFSRSSVSCSTTRGRRRARGLFVAQRLEGVGSPSEAAAPPPRLGELAESAPASRRCVSSVSTWAFASVQAEGAAPLRSCGGRPSIPCISAPGAPCGSTCELSADLRQHVLETFEIGFGGLEAQLRFMTAGIKARDAGGVLKDAAALCGFALTSSPICPCWTSAGFVRRWRRRRKGFARPSRAPPWPFTL